MQNWFKSKTLAYVGHALALAGVGFVGYQLYTNPSSYQDAYVVSRRSALAWFLTFAVLYALTITTLAMAWRAILAHLQVSLSKQTVYEIYGASQLAKYVPGNVMHFASRHMIAQSMGIDAKTLIKSTMIELLLQAAVAASFALLLCHTVFSGLHQWHSLWLFIGGSVAVLWVMSRRFGPGAFYAALYFYAFFILSGAGFVAINALVFSEQAIAWSSAIQLAAVFVVAWLVGFVTPGAPAGLGVRELVLIALLPVLSTKIPVVAAVIYMRGVTISGDFIMFLLASLTKLMRKRRA